MHTPTFSPTTIIAQHPWLIAEHQSCVISPDSDGILCGLLVSNILGWKIRGFYDGKVLAIAKNQNPNTCVFLDMEIYRSHIRSIGQHLVLYDTGHLPETWSEFSHCISANNLRGHDFKHTFQKKYPLGTIHLLLALLGSTRDILISTDAIAPLLYTDGTFKNQFNYPENVMSWLTYMGIEHSKPLQQIFKNEHYSTYNLMVALKALFEDIRALNQGKRGGDKIVISNKNGQPVNITDTGSFAVDERTKAETFIRLLGDRTGWQYQPELWTWDSLVVHTFTKASTIPTLGRYNALMAQHPLSLAITSSTTIEYTLDTNNLFRQ